MTSRSTPHTLDAEPARRFLTNLDTRLGPSSAPIGSWPATVLYWTSQTSKLIRHIHDRRPVTSLRMRAGAHEGEAG